MTITSSTCKHPEHHDPGWYDLDDSKCSHGNEYRCSAHNGGCPECQKSTEEWFKRNRVKQVIVIRKDLSMRKGKFIAQGSHASMAFLSKAVQEIFNGKALKEVINKETLEWLKGKFTKACVYVNSEVELDEIYAKAKEAGLIVELIVDSGLTEFHGVPTKTCLAIGPARSFLIDEITGHLKLL